MPSKAEQVVFDPGRARLDLSLGEAFDLTRVRSLEDFCLLKEKLPEIRGLCYFFVNILDSQARLLLTVIVADDSEVTSTIALDHQALGIDHQMLLKAGRESGNYPLPPELKHKVLQAMNRDEWLFFKIA